MPAEMYESRRNSAALLESHWNRGSCSIVPVSSSSTAMAAYVGLFPLLSWIWVVWSEKIIICSGLIPNSAILVWYWSTTKPRICSVGACGAFFMYCHLPLMSVSCHFFVTSSNASRWDTARLKPLVGMYRWTAALKSDTINCGIWSLLTAFEIQSKAPRLLYPGWSDAISNNTPRESVSTVFMAEEYDAFSCGVIASYSFTAAMASPGFIPRSILAAVRRTMLTSLSVKSSNDWGAYRAAWRYSSAAWARPGASARLLARNMPWIFSGTTL